MIKNSLRTLKRKWSLWILPMLVFLSQPGFGKVEILGTWQTGTSHPKESGNHRALIFIAHGEKTSAMSLVAVSYGGQSMTKVIEQNYSAGGGYAYVAAFILDEAGIAAAGENTFAPNWGTAPTEIKYASVFLSGVNQTDLTGPAATAGGTTASLSTSSLPTNDGDMVISAATCGNLGTYTFQNGFIQGTNDSSISSTGTAGYKPAAGTDETPSVSHNSVNRQVLIGFVVNAAPLDPNKASHPTPSDGAKNVPVSIVLSWDSPTAYTPSCYEVYCGTNPDVRRNPKNTVDTNRYDPPGNLEPGQTYYWTVDSFDGQTSFLGDRWSFTTFKPVDRVVGNMILINDNAGWCWYQDEKIVYDPVGDNILTSTAAEGHGFGGINGQRVDDLDATIFHIATGRRTRVLMRNGGQDDHNMGAFWIRPDGRYLHLYCPHYTNQTTYYRLAAYPHDGSIWGTEQSYNWLTIPNSPGSDTMTSSYTNIVYLTGEGTGSGRLYNMHRIFERTPCIAYSDDWGQTWTYMGRLNGITGTTTYSNFYHKFKANGPDRIDFIGCEQHPRNFTNSIYHGYIKNGKSYDSYGNEIDTINDQDAPPIGVFTPVWRTGPVAEGQYHTGWTNELEIDQQGYPVCLFQTRFGLEPFGGHPGAADHRFFYGRFNGSSWTVTELAKMGPGLHTPEQDYIGMGCIHPDDANVVYISTPFDPRDNSPLAHHEIFKGRTTDFGATWKWTQITIDSTEDNIRPAVPKWDKDNTAVFWLRGKYPYTEDYDLVLVGMVEKKDLTQGLVQYVDADENNTTRSDGAPFTSTGPSGSAGAADNQWHKYTGYGIGGSCYVAGDGGTEDAPAVRTTINGLPDGTYDVFAYFWCDPTQDWGVRAGLEASDLLCFSKQSSQHAEPSQFDSPVQVVKAPFLMYRVYIGRQQVAGGSAITVFIDDYDGSYNLNAPARTTFDGIGVAPVFSGPVSNPGDLNRDGRVDLLDFAVLGQHWQTSGTMNTLIEVAQNWLYGI